MQPSREYCMFCSEQKEMSEVDRFGRRICKDCVWEQGRTRVPFDPHEFWVSVSIAVVFVMGLVAASRLFL